MVDPTQIVVVAAEMHTEDRGDSKAVWVLRQLSEDLCAFTRKKKYRLTEAEVDAFCLEVKQYFANHWRDDDNPEIGCCLKVVLLILKINEPVQPFRCLICVLA